MRRMPRPAELDCVRRAGAQRLRVDVRRRGEIFDRQARAI